MKTRQIFEKVNSPHKQALLFKIALLSCQETTSLKIKVVQFLWSTDWLENILF